MAKKLIHFDWAVKKILRHKANFDILEGFLTELLKFDITIESILESEGNKEDVYDKFNRVDILARNTKGELLLIEVQNNPQKDYFHRMLYGVSKLITEYIQEGHIYSTVKKVFSINIVYFDLGQGSGYVYEYRGDFVDLHTGQILQPPSSQQTEYKIQKIADIYPKYYILKVNNFDDNAKNTLDEWIYFLKNSEVKDSFRAKGLKQAQEKLIYEQLSEVDRKAYQRYQDNKRIEESVTATLKEEGLKEGMEKGIKEGREKGLKEGIQQEKLEIAKNALRVGAAPEFIVQITGLSLEQIAKIKKDNK